MTDYVRPWLPAGAIVADQERGEFFVRLHRHASPEAPVVVLLHGWTATCDLQYFTAYRALAAGCSIVGIDHRGHGRGLRSPEPFTLEAAADDAAAVLRTLGIERAIIAGYSMGGPIAMLMARRHPERVSGLVMMATALEWMASRRDRVVWRALPVFGAFLRSRLHDRMLRRGVRRLIGEDHEVFSMLPWAEAELRRNGPSDMLEAGRALSDYDARAWAPTLGVPAGALITTADRLVRPRKQRQLAHALDAEVRELDGDHFCSLVQPREFSSSMVELVRSVDARSRTDSLPVPLGRQLVQAGGDALDAHRQ